MAKKSLPIRSYIRIIFRRKWAILLPAIAGVLLMPFVVTQTRARYRASAIVKRQDLAIVGAVPTGLMARDAPHISLEALRVEILTWRNLQKVILQTNLHPELTDPDKNQALWQRQFAELNKIITISRVAQSPGIDLVEISATHSDPEMARRIVDGVASFYMEEAQRTGREDIEKLVDFLKERTEQNRQALRRAEQQLDKYHEIHFASLDDVKLGIRNRIMNLRTDESARSLQLAALKQQHEEAKEQIADIPETVSEVATEINPALAEMERQLNERRMALVVLQLRYTEEHPKIVQLKEEVAQLQTRFAQTPERVIQVEREVPNPVHQQVSGEIMALRQQIRANQAAILEIGTRILANEESLRAVSGEERAYRDYQRDQEQYAGLYAAYQSSLIAAQTRMDVDRDARYGTRVDMISPPQTPAFPEKQTPRKVAAATVMGGIAIGLALVFLLELFDRSIRDVEDATSFLKFPVLGSIPIITTQRERERKRLWRFLVLASVIAIVAGTLSGLIWMERLNPGTTEALMSQGREFIVRLAK